MIIHSAFENSYLWLPAVGFVVGLLASGIGAGGGLFYLLSLLLLFDVPSPVAVSTSLAATLPISVVGSVGHFRYGHIHLQLALVFAISGIAGAWLGAKITNIISTETLKTGFGIYAILLAAQMLYNNRKFKKTKATNENNDQEVDRKKITKGAGFGALAGLITGAFGTGGAAPVLAGLFALQLPVKLVVGTSLLVVLANTVFGLMAHAVVGKIDLTLVYFLGSGAVAGAILGPFVLSKIKLGGTGNKMQFWYAVGLVAIGILMIVA